MLTQLQKVVIADKILLLLNSGQRVSIAGKEGAYEITVFDAFELGHSHYEGPTLWHAAIQLPYPEARKDPDR